MMKAVYCLFLAVFINLFVSCTKNRSFIADAEKIYGTPIHTECILGTPVSLTFAEPSYLLMFDRYAKRTLTWIDLSNDRCLRLLPEGKGPDEVIPPYKIFIPSSVNNLFCVYQFQTGMIYQYSLDSINSGINHVRPVKRLKLEDSPNPANIVSVSDYYAGIGIFDKGRLHLYDQQGKLVSSGGQYPFRGEDMEPLPRFLTYQGNIVSNPEGSRFVVASSYGDNLEFYTVTDNGISLVQKYETRDADVFFNRTGNIQFRAECLLGYKDACGGEKYCYLLYSGKTYAENNHRTHSGKYLQVFNWNGEFIKAYELDRDILTVCVDEKNSTLYGVGEHDEQTSILQYDL